MNKVDKVAICSRSFSRNETLRQEILSRYKNVTFNETGEVLKGSSLIQFLRGHNKAITALEIIDDTILSALPELEVISKYGVGLDMIDLDAMERHGKRLGWKAGVNKRSVSELVIAFAISMLRHVPQSNKDVLNGNWNQHVGQLLSQKTVGIIGCGQIGKDLVRLLQPFGCKILVNDITDYSDFYQEYGVNSVHLNELLTASDIVTIHTPLDDSTANILSKDRLNLLRASSILINVARGGLIDETHLKSMLLNGQLAAAAFDVLTVEPPVDYDLINSPNFFVTPHIGGSSKEAIMGMGRAAIDGLGDG